MRKTRQTPGGDQPLDQEALDRVVGGMDVKIDQVTSTVNTAASGGLGSNVLGGIVKNVVEGIKGKDRPS
ncbi:MAG TPA: hypothetical protein VHA35_18965 [Dongiaceae bacterium]|nr:hypothetical protein [Dongiaceae bacterium]